MAKPYIHAKSSVRKWGGEPQDYLDIHQFMDSSKAHLADVRHRALLHSSFGCFIVEQMFGVVRTNSEDKEYSPRDVAEQHCIEDMGRIPSVQDWLGGLEIQGWMGPPKAVRKMMTYEEVAEKLLQDATPSQQKPCGCYPDEGCGGCDR